MISKRFSWIKNCTTLLKGDIGTYSSYRDTEQTTGCSVQAPRWDEIREESQFNALYQR